MTRATVITAHLVALPVALVLAAALAVTIPSHRAVDIQLHDTYFVVAHFHATVVLATSVLVATVVAYRYGAINGLIVVAWALLIIHVASAAAQNLGRQGSPSAEPGAVMIVLPSHPGMAYLYFATFVGGFGANVLGIAMSLWVSVHGGKRTWSA
jgi:hypothetical protein